MDARRQFDANRRRLAEKRWRAVYVSLRCALILRWLKIISLARLFQARSGRMALNLCGTAQNCSSVWFGVQKGDLAHVYRLDACFIPISCHAQNFRRQWPDDQEFTDFHPQE